MPARMVISIVEQCMHFVSLFSCVTNIIKVYIFKGKCKYPALLIASTRVDPFDPIGVDSPNPKPMVSISSLETAINIT